MQVREALHPMMIDYLKTTIGRITFEYSYSWKSTANSLIYYTCEENEFEDKCQAEYNYVFKRLSRILEFFIEDSAENTKLSYSEIYKAKKTYYEFIPALQLELYNEMAEIIGFHPISRMFPDSVLLSAAKMDNPSDHIDISAIQKEYPFAFRDKSNGACFFETVFLSIIFHTIYCRAMNVFLRPLTDETSVIWTKKWLIKVNKLCHDPKFLSQLTNEVLDSMYQVVANEKNKNFENIMRNYYLREKYRERKDFKRLMNNINARPSYQELNQNVNTDWKRLNVTVKCEKGKLNDYILNVIFTLADRILNGKTPMVVDVTNEDLDEYQCYSILTEKTTDFINAVNRIIKDFRANDIDITQEDYLAACIVANICVKYTSSTIKKAQELLSYMVNERTLQAMYNNMIAQTNNDLQE